MAGSMVDGVEHGEIFDCATPQYIRTANTPFMHQTALKYETGVSDGGRLKLKTPREREPVLSVSLWIVMRGTVVTSIKPLADP